MLNTNPAGPEGAGEQGVGGRVRIHLGSVSWLLLLPRCTSRFCLPLVRLRPFSRAAEALGFWASIVPWSFPGSCPRQEGSPKDHKNIAALCSVLVAESRQAGWKNSKCPGNPQKISCRFLAVWHAAETPLVSTAKHYCPCVLDGMRQNSARPQPHMSAMCAGGSRLQPPQTF